MYEYSSFFPSLSILTLFITIASLGAVKWYLIVVFHLYFHNDVTEPCVHQDPGERSSDPAGDWPRLARECPGGSSWGVGQWWPAAGLGALSVAVHAWRLLREVTIIFITSTIVWPQVNSHRTGKGQFSFQSQRKAMPKNAQTTAQLHLSHTLGK